jgi:hypothetical protein
MHPPGGRTGSGRIFNHDLGLRPVLLVPGELKKQDMKELEDAWFEETHIANLFQQLRTGGTPLGKLFDDARQRIVDENPAFADFLTDSTTPQRTQLATELQRTVTGMTLAASRNVPSFTLGDLAPSWMVSFWLSNENYSKLFADERRTRNTSIQHASVEPVEPSNCGQAILFDTTNLKPQEMHERLHAVLGSVLQSGFIKWSDNMCHFDAPFAVKLACVVAVGPGYWKTPIGTERRELSRTEQWDVDLLCSVQTNTERQVQHLRNMYMWHFMSPFGLFGKPFDAMQHPAVCSDDDKDGWHAVQSAYIRKSTTMCICTSKNITSHAVVDGVIRVVRTQVVDGEHMQASNVQDAVLFALAGQRPKRNYSCAQAVEGHAGSRCVGVYTDTLVTIRFGPIVVVALEAQGDFAPDVTPTLVLGNYTLFLVGMVLRTPGHYVARFWSLVDNKWYDYNDLTTYRVSATPDKDVKLSNPARFRGNLYPITGLWYVDKSWSGSLKYVTLAELSRQVHAKQNCRVAMVPEQVEEVL